MRFPLYAFPAYAAGAVADQLSALSDALISVDGSPPQAASGLRKSKLRKALVRAHGFSVYANVNGKPEIAVFTIWDITSTFLTARTDGLPLKQIPLSALWEDQDIILPDCSPDTRAPKGPIDAVYTWVNADDAQWRELLREAGGASRLDQDRFGQTDELRYSLRSLFMHAPWINNVFIFSNCRPPDWFVPRSNIFWVDHRDVIPREFLPTFNSNAIESFLWQIDGLSEQFIYFNDDFFLGRYFHPNEFFLGNGSSVTRFDNGALVPSMLAAPSSLSDEWQSATVNAARHFHEHYGVFPGQLHAHVPYTVCRSVAALMERDFQSAFTALRSHRFRSKDDVPPISFLYPHYAQWNRLSQNLSSKSALISQHNFREIIVGLKKGTRYDFYCINDGGQSSQSAEFNRFKTEFGELMYPLASPCERGRTDP